MRTHFLSDMTFEEAEEAFRQTDTAFVPMGAVEAHGPHGIIGTDHFAADEVARRAAAKCNAVSLPAVPYGYCESTMDFPGTISLSPQTSCAVLEDVARSLHSWGVRRIIWITGHGPNAPVMKQVSLKLRRELGMLFAIRCGIAWQSPCCRSTTSAPTMEGYGDLGCYGVPTRERESRPGRGWV